MIPCPSLLLSLLFRIEYGFGNDRLRKRLEPSNHAERVPVRQRLSVGLFELAFAQLFSCSFVGLLRHDVPPSRCGSTRAWLRIVRPRWPRSQRSDLPQNQRLRRFAGYDAG